MSTALEEKRKELDALQAEFDEYIESSREMEEEMEADLDKYQNDLAKAESRNSALASQLVGLRSQLNSLQTKLSTVSAQLSSETRRRISAETRTEEAENKQREAEGTLAVVRSREVRKLREENEELCERIAFVEGEAEDCRNELNVERERYRQEVGELREDLNVLRVRLKETEDGLGPMESGGDNDNAVEDTILDGDGAMAMDRASSAQNELEMVTEQLIEAKTKRSQTPKLGGAWADGDQANENSADCVQRTNDSETTAAATEVREDLNVLKVRLREKEDGLGPRESGGDKDNDNDYAVENTILDGDRAMAMDRASSAQNEVEMFTEQLIEAKTKISLTPKLGGDWADGGQEKSAECVQRTNDSVTPAAATELMGDLNVLKVRLKETENELSLQQSGGENDNDVEDTILDGDRSMANELEMVAKQLNDAKAKLSQTSKLEGAWTGGDQTNSADCAQRAHDYVASAATTEANSDLLGKIATLELSVKLLREENAALKEGSNQDCAPCCTIS